MIFQYFSDVHLELLLNRYNNNSQSDVETALEEVLSRIVPSAPNFNPCRRHWFPSRTAGEYSAREVSIAPVETL